MTQAPLSPFVEDPSDEVRRRRTRAIVGISRAHTQDRAVARLELELATRHGHAIACPAHEDGSRDVVALGAGDRELERITLEPNGIIRTGPLELSV